jgi:protein-disulfide isomerase
MNNPWIIVGVIAAVLIGGSWWYSTSVSASYNEGVEVKSHIKGNPDAAVTLAEYSDFQCPACAQFAPVVKEILDAYGDQIAFEYKHFPLMQIHANAEAAARAAEAAGQQGKFYEYHDVLFEKQSEWSSATIPGAFFARYAEELGLDKNLFTRHQRSSLLQGKVRDQFNEARSKGLTGTPTFFLNGERMQISTYQDFREQIEAALGIVPTEAVVEPAVEFGV